MTGPRRRASDNHHHPEMWTEADQWRFEDRIVQELEKIRRDVHTVTMRIATILGGVTVGVFLINMLIHVWLSGGL